jgi:hypothetical protein
MSNLINDKIDHRKHIRLIEDMPLSIKIKTQETSGFKETPSKNISEGGLSLKYKYFFKTIHCFLGLILL